MASRSNTSRTPPRQRLQGIQRSICGLGLRPFHRVREESGFQLIGPYGSSRDIVSSSEGLLIERYLTGDGDAESDTESDADDSWSADTEELLRRSAEEAEPSDSVDTLPLYEEASWVEDPPPTYHQHMNKNSNGGCPRWCPFHRGFWKIRRVSCKNTVQVASNNCDSDILNTRSTPSSRSSKAMVVSDILAQILWPKRKISMQRPTFHWATL